jgi:thioredoxin reductase
VTIEEASVTSILGERVTVNLEDGCSIALAGLFLVPRTSFASPLAERMGCALDDGPVGPFIQTDMRKETSVPGVFACGDAARAAGSVFLAMGDSAMAGTGVHQSLVFL